MAAKRRKIVKEDFDLGYGTTTIPTDTGGTRAATKTGIQTFLPGAVNAADFTGADIGAQVNAAAAILTLGGTIYIPNGTYSFTTTIELTQGIILKGQTRTGVILNWTGSSSGVAIKVGPNASNIECRDFTLKTSQGTNTVGFKIDQVSNSVVKNVTITGGTTTTGFKYPFYVTGDSTTVHIAENYIDSFIGAGLLADHCTDLYFKDNQVWSVADGITAIGVILDTGTSGFYSSGNSIHRGQHGMFIQDTASGGAGNSPRFIFSTDDVIDTTTGGSGLVFDTTMSTNVVSAFFTNPWIAASGLNAAASVVTSGADGVTINGGTGINFMGGRIRRNANNGILFNSASTTGGAQVFGTFIYHNNQNNNADANGVYIAAAATNIGLIGCVIGDSTALDIGGHQKYGVKIAAVASLEFRMIGCDLNNNTTGPFSNGNTGNAYIIGNLPSSGAINNVEWGAVIPGVSGEALGSTANVWNAYLGTVIIKGNTPAGAAGQLGVGITAGFGAGAAGTTVTTTTKGGGSGPTTATAVANYLKITLSGTEYWIPLMV